MMEGLLFGLFVGGSCGFMLGMLVMRQMWRWADDKSPEGET